MTQIIRYNRNGLKDIVRVKEKTIRQKQAMGRDISSLIRLFLVIMVFVVIVLTIAK